MEFVIFILLNTFRYILIPFIIFIAYTYLVGAIALIIDQYVVEVNHEIMWPISIWGGLLAIIGYFFLVFKRKLLHRLYKNVL